MKGRFQISRSLPAIFLLLCTSLLHAIPPVLNYAGQVAVDGEPFQGKGLFKFALIKGDNNTTIWSNDGSSVNGSEPLKSVSTSVDGGLYSILLGNSSIKGMSSLNPSIFQKHSNVKLRVWFSDGINEFEQLSPDRSFASVPYAFSAGSAPIPQGSINRKMLSADVRSDLNSSLKKITRDMLPKSVLEDLNSSIKKIKRDMLPDNVLAQLDRKLTRSDLPADVLTDLNRTIQLNSLSPEVLSALQVTPSISTQPFARYDWRTDSATIEARGRGHNLSYQWLKNGKSIAGANAPVLVLAKPTLDDNATYAVVISNSVGQTTSQTITLQQAVGSPGLPIAEANATQVPRNGLILWLDGADLNADGFMDNFLSGTNLVQWTDKVSGKHAIPTSSTNHPTIADKSVYFDGSDSIRIADLNLSAEQIFIVLKKQKLIGSFLKGEGAATNIKLDNFGISKSDWSDFVSGNGDVRISKGPNRTMYDQIFLASLLKKQTLGNDAYKWDIGNSLEIGLNSFKGHVYEVIIYDRVLNQIERDSVEDFLIHKWQIETSRQYGESFPEPKPETDMVAYWKFDKVEIASTMIWDFSGNDRHLGTSGLDSDNWISGVDGDALFFDGSNDRTTDSRSVGNFNFRSVCFWVKPTVPVDGRNDWNVALSVGWATSGLYEISFNKVISSGSGHFSIGRGTSFRETLETYNSLHEGWFHLAAVFDQADGTSGGYNLYLNGDPLPLTPMVNSGLMSGNHDFDFGRKGQPYFRGSLDEMKVYDRILPASEVKALFNSYQNPIIRTSGEHNATVGTNFSLSLAADNGPTTYLAEGLPSGLSLNVTTGQITGTLSQPGYHRVFVKAMNEHGTGSDTIAIIARPQTDQYGWPVDVPDGSAIPQNGLVLWLDANDVDADGKFDTGTDHLKLANWADKAGKDHNATQATAANQPEIRSGQISGKPNLNVLVFDGNQSLSFPTIGQGRTFFWVIKMHPDTSEHANFFSYTSSTLWGINGKPASYGKQALKLNGYSESVISNGNWKVNGNSVNQNDFVSFSPTTISLVSSDLASSNLIGRHNSESLPGDLIDSFFSGNICEILIYDQALTSNQIETVEKYLGQKWGISISHDTTPSPSGNPPTYRVTPANDSVTTAHLTEQILKYLKPEITAQPQANNVFADTNHTFSVTAEGKYLKYQWKKNGLNLAGETNSTLVLTDANATQHDGNYSVVVSNDFGSVESTKVSVFVANEVLDGLVGWWPLDGNASDFSGGQNHGTISGSPLWVTGKIGDAVRFNSVNQQISTNSNFGTQNSISIWCNFSSTSSGQFQMVWSFSNPNLAFDSSAVSLNRMDGSANKFADFSALQFANQWLHFVTVNTSSQTELYLNAASIGTANYVSPSTNNFVIGKGGYTLNGIVDEVRIYDRALSNTEIQTLYNLGQ